MGLFSRKDKTPKASSISTARSNASVHSGSSSIKSPGGFSNWSNGRTQQSSVSLSAYGNGNNRSSAGTTGSMRSPLTPVTPYTPSYHAALPHVEMPRPPDPSLDPAGYLRSLGAVRERCRIVTDKAMRNELRHFDVDMDKFPDVVNFVTSIIKVRCFFPLWSVSNLFST